jgi:hypothetical protein
LLLSAYQRSPQEHLLFIDEQPDYDTSYMEDRRVANEKKIRELVLTPGPGVGREFLAPEAAENGEDVAGFKLRPDPSCGSRFRRGPGGGTCADGLNAPENADMLITSLNYFSGLVDEVAETQVSEDYWNQRLHAQLPVPAILTAPERLLAKRPHMP